MTNLTTILAKASALPKKIEKRLLEHDKAYFKNTPFALTSPQVEVNRKNSAEKIYKILEEFLTAIFTPRVLKSVAVDQPLQVDPGSPDVLHVIGKPRNFFIYCNRDLTACLLDYLGRARCSASEFLQDDAVTVFKIMSSVFRSAEVYQIVDDAGRFEQLSKLQGLKDSGLTLDDMDKFLRTGKEAAGTL